MQDNVFAELSLVIAITAAISLLMKMIRQPLILGYILAGLIVGPTMFNLIHSAETFHAFSSIGIALLLFIIGLGMNITELKKLGRVVILATTASFVTMTMVTYAISSTLLGFTKTEAFLTGLALFFSSTIIIVKILSDKKEQNRLHGQIAIGVILTEDLIATLALLFIVAGQGEGLDFTQLLTLFAKGVLLLGALALCSTQLLPRVSKHIANSQELLFLFAIAWGFGIATIFKMSGFSIEVGALFGGVALASSPYAREIASRLKPLRDFFIVLFFITLGETMNVSNLSTSILPAIMLSAIVMLLKPFAIISSMGALGYTKRVSFKAGINLSQISEFSIILIVLASANNLVREDLTAIISLVAIITIAISTYLMLYSDQLFPKFDKIKLRLFEKQVSYKESRGAQGYSMVLFGYHHGGHEFIKAFREIGKRYLVVDYDPGVIESLEQQQIPYIYGDATDHELLEEINIHRAKLVISTLSNFEDTQQLVTSISRQNPSAVIICHADNRQEAVKLYELGSTYVMIPQYIGSEKISSFIRKFGLDKNEFNHYRDKHLDYLHSIPENSEAT